MKTIAKPENICISYKKTSELTGKDANLFRSPHRYLSKRSVGAAIRNHYCYMLIENKLFSAPKSEMESVLFYSQPVNFLLSA